MARWRPEVADELITCASAPALAPPRGRRPAAVDLAGALQALGDRGAGAGDDGGAVIAPRSTPRATRCGRSTAARRACGACSPRLAAVTISSRRRSGYPRPDRTMTADSAEDAADHAHRQGPPGVTSAIFNALSRAGVEVLDIEQIVLRRRLVLGVLVTAPRDWKKLRDAIERRRRRARHAVEVDRGRATTGPARRAAATSRCRTPLKAAAMAAMAGRIADIGAQHRPDRADGALPGDRDRPARLRRRPRQAARHRWPRRPPAQGVDVAVQPANLLRRGMRLIVMDVDSTLMQGEVIEMLAEHAGCADEVARVTEAGDAR